MDTLKKAYPSIGWDSYLTNLLSSVEKAVDVVSDQDDFTFLGGAYRDVVKEADYVPYAQRRGRGVTRFEDFRKFQDMKCNDIGHRVGRRFTRKFDDEDPAVGCIDALMAYMPYGPGYVYVKSMEDVRDQVVKDITHQTDLVIANFQADYYPIIAAYNKNKTDFYTILNMLKAGLENREAFRLLVAPDNKGDSLEYPQAYNYAGQGGTGGHELTHGFDDEGQQAAYNAYRQYIKEQGHEELRLPGLAQFSPNQIFWITYGYSWCMKQNDANLVNQLLTNPHAPGSCRTNQVMQDIPSFGKDFGCRQGSPMYPKPDQRCKVWVGY
ncbi:peptidase family M13 [Teladorsagia circumcincta]|uniref:Peptidase family M13 n=1 Tax=Teladorsagia circumcincta TaxID=45464 RepID=A0A2G9ULQ9_TELCI|nr:peptidase family M13 [Teladorsagia circumcincta]